MRPPSFPGKKKIMTKIDVRPATQGLRTTAGKTHDFLLLPTGGPGVSIPTREEDWDRFGPRQRGEKPYPGKVPAGSAQVPEGGGRSQRAL